MPNGRSETIKLSHALNAERRRGHAMHTVELIGYYGSDETHACSAWTSTNRELTDERRGRLGSFLKQLAENGHETPFEKSMLHFLVTSEVASHIHLLKHRIGVSVNAESGRYKEFREDDRYYVPADWPEEAQQAILSHYAACSSLYHRLVKELSATLGRKRAKESARFVLPYGHQITSDVSFNFRSFVHFQRLRNSTHAQREIQQIAEKMLSLVHQTGAFNLSIEAFGL